MLKKKWTWIKCGIAREKTVLRIVIYHQTAVENDMHDMFCS